MRRRRTIFATALALCLLLSASPARAGSITINFGAGLPAGTALFGSAVVDAGVLKLTDTGLVQGGQFYIDDLDAGQPVTALTASFQMLIGGGPSPNFPADGLSLSFASDLPSVPTWGAPGEEGAGSGLIVSFDTWDNFPLFDDAIAIDVFFNGMRKGRFPYQSSQGPAPTFLDVLLVLRADGTLDLSYGAVTAFSGLQTGYTPISGGRFAFAARTGGASDNHWIDDLTITTEAAAPAPVPDPGSSIVLLGTGLMFVAGAGAWVSGSGPGRFPQPRPMKNP